MIEQYWKAHAEALHRFLQQRTDPTLADDLLQEVFLRVQERYDQLRDAHKIRPWLFQVARNILQDHYRRQQRQHQHLTQYQALESLHQQVVKMEEPICCQASDCMPKLVQRLPEPYRTALLETAYGTTGQKEYAQAHGLNYATAKSRIQRARRQLKACVARHCPNLLPEGERGDVQNCCTY